MGIVDILVRERLASVAWRLIYLITRNGPVTRFSRVEFHDTLGAIESGSGKIVLRHYETKATVRLCAHGKVSMKRKTELSPTCMTVALCNVLPMGPAAR